MREMSQSEERVLETLSMVGYLEVRNETSQTKTKSKQHHLHLKARTAAYQRDFWMAFYFCQLVLVADTVYTIQTPYIASLS